MLKTGQQRYLSANSTQAAFGSDISGIRGSTTLSPFRWIHLGNGQGLDLVFFGSGADNSTFSYKIWCGNGRVGDEPRYAPAYLEASLYASGVCTLSTAAIDSSLELISSTAERVADTLAFTISASPNGPGTYLTDAFQLLAPTAYSPANNTVARLTIPQLGRLCTSVAFEFALGGSATGANVLYAITA